MTPSIRVLVKSPPMLNGERVWSSPMHAAVKLASVVERWVLHLERLLVFLGLIARESRSRFRNGIRA